MFDSRFAKTGPGEHRHPSVFFDSIFDTQPTAAFVIDLADQIVVWNRGAVALFEIAAESALGRDVRELDLIALVPKLTDRIEDVKKTQLPTRIPEVRVSGSRDEAVTAAITLLPAFDDQRRMIGIVVWADDRTDAAHLRQQMGVLIEERRIKEQELQRINEKLEDARDELTAARQNPQAYIARLQPERHKGEFMAKVARDLRDSLAPVVAALPMLRRKAPDEPAVEKAVEILERQVRRQTQLLNDLLDASRNVHPKMNAPAPSYGILIIEDDPASRDALRLLLQIEGHRVEIAEEGARGLAMAEALRPDVALIDIGLPGVSGYEVARRLRATERGNRLRLIALTDYSDSDNRHRALDAGFDRYLVKPVETTQLLCAIAELMEERRVEDREPARR